MFLSTTKKRKYKFFFPLFCFVCFLIATAVSITSLLSLAKAVFEVETVSRHDYSVTLRPGNKKAKCKKLPEAEGGIQSAGIALKVF